VNRLLAAGWRLLNVYTLRYEENGVWRERPTESPDFPRKAPQETPALFPIRAKSLGGATHARK
jgi:hypothetical protein